MISRPTILRAAVTRFIPGVLTFLRCCLYAAARLKGLTLERPQIDGFTNLTLFMTLGFVASLGVARRLLPSTAGVAGRRGLFAGFASPVVLLALEMLHGSPTSHALNYAFAVAAGSITTVMVFVPWSRARGARVGRVHVASGRANSDDSTMLFGRATPIATRGT